MSESIVRRNTAFLTFTVGALFFIGCNTTTTNQGLVGIFDIPEKAYDVRKLNIGTKDNQQLFFRIVRPYPSTELLAKYGQTLDQAAWTRCFGKLESWDVHEDRSSTDQLLVHQIANYWIMRKEKKLAIISITYYSKMLIDRRKPDNDVQNVNVLMQQGLNLQREIDALSLKCGQ